MSQPTVSRVLRRAGQRVVRIGRGKATRYASARGVFGGGLVVPLFLVDDAGLIRQVANLRSLTSGQYVVEGSGAPFWLRGESGTGLFDSLPYFIYDLRPAGFIGRQIARHLSDEWSFPSDPRDWRDDHIGQYLGRHGEDTPGNLLVGDGVADRANRAAVMSVQDRAVEYPRRVQWALSEGLPASSAAGEQPKFLSHHEQSGHVIVKFSPAGQTAEARRWRDLLRAEYQALALLRSQDIPAARADMIELDGRVLLESRRFDREGLRGRIPALSLTMVDAEFVGVGRGWSRVAEQLHNSGLLDRRSLDQLIWAESFGSWIGNHDMHLGNVSLTPTDDGFRLLPLYDMLPMAFAPLRGELRRVELPAPIRDVAHEDAWATAGYAATKYWLQLADDDTLSDDFRATARAHGAKWRVLLGTGPA